mgnify:FL=1
MKQDSTDSLATGWTDDKHRSYLTFMEENFVKDMYEREYCAVDVCGHEACHQGANTVTHSQQKNVHEVPIPHNSRYQFHVFYTYECTYVCMFVCIYEFKCVYTCVYMCIYELGIVVHAYTYVCVH